MDAGSLGLGPHLVVQLDDQEPLRISSAEAAANVAMPALRPGSHRVTVYAARPWGEAVKAPGASAQIRLNRVARNAAELPASGSAQLIAASPDALQQIEPVLIDWLLLDAPLQNLRGDDARWRLRISVNGDSFLVDRQTPYGSRALNGAATRCSWSCSMAEAIRSTLRSTAWCARWWLAQATGQPGCAPTSRQQNSRCWQENNPHQRRKRHSPVNTEPQALAPSAEAAPARGTSP